MKIFTYLLATITVLILMALPTWLLWNLLMPDIFGLDTINIWQALGITFLAKILFGGFDIKNE